MPRQHRRPIGPRNPRGAGRRAPNSGATPYRTIAEQEMYGAAVQPRTPNIDSRPGYTRAEIYAAIDEASRTLGPDKRAALQRAQWLWDDAELLTTRPTNTSYPPRPRTLAAGYDNESETLFVRFRGRRTGPMEYADGVGYEYYGVSPQEWATFRNNWSPGRYINRVLNGKPYTPATW